MNTQATLEQLSELGLHGMARHYESILQLPLHQQPESHDLLSRLTQSENQYRSNRKTQMFLRLSKLRYAAHIEQIECSKSRNLSKEQLSLLADGQFIRSGQNVLITGATGCGKSYLACALGHQACLLGYKTLYFNMNRLVERIATAKLDGTYVSLLNSIDKAHLLVLDDFGLQPMDASVRLALLQILEDRYSKKAVIIASQLPVAKWYEYIQDETLADAIMDRLLAHAHRIELKGESMRKKQLESKP